MIASNQFLSDPADFLDRHPRIDAHNLQRVSQSFEVIVQSEEVSAEGPQLFGDGLLTIRATLQCFAPSESPATLARCSDRSLPRLLS